MKCYKCTIAITLNFDELKVIAEIEQITFSVYQKIFTVKEKKNFR